LVAVARFVWVGGGLPTTRKSKSWRQGGLGGKPTLGGPNYISENRHNWILVQIEKWDDDGDRNSPMNCWNI